MIRRSMRRALRRLAQSTPPTEASSGGWRTVAPPAHAARLRCAAHDTYVPAWDAATVDAAFAVRDDGQPFDFEQPMRSRLAEIGVGVFSDARVFGKPSWPVSAADEFLIDAVYVSTSREYRTYARPARVMPTRSLGGVTVNLNSLFAARNYGHALLDGVSRIAVLSRAGFDVRDADHVVAPAFVSAPLMRILMLAGVDPDTVIRTTPGTDLRCEKLWQTSFPGHPRHYGPVQAAFMRSLAVSPSGSGRRLLLLRRGARRSVANVDELVEVAHEYDLELYEPGESDFPPADFAAASLVVGAHGAGLSDLGFMPVGSTFVELVPSSHRHPYFATLARGSGLAYTAVLGQSESGDNNADFLVDPERLRRVLDRVG